MKGASGLNDVDVVFCAEAEFVLVVVVRVLMEEQKSSKLALERTGSRKRYENN